MQNQDFLTLLYLKDFKGAFLKQIVYIMGIYIYIYNICIYIILYTYDHSYIYICIWVNYNISLTWIKAIWGWFPFLTVIPVRSQWGRYNLPRYIYIYRFTHEYSVINNRYLHIQKVYVYIYLHIWFVLMCMCISIWIYWISTEPIFHFLIHQSPIANRSPQNPPGPPVVLVT
jgi:hypothetical protein